MGHLSTNTEPHQLWQPRTHTFRSQIWNLTSELGLCPKAHTNMIFRILYSGHIWKSHEYRHSGLRNTDKTWFSLIDLDFSLKILTGDITSSHGPPIYQLWLSSSGLRSWRSWGRNLLKLEFSFTTQIHTHTHLYSFDSYPSEGVRVTIPN